MSTIQVSAKDYLKSQVEAKLAEATAITENAGKAARALDDGEKARVKHLIDEVHEHNKRIEDIEANDEIAETIDRMKGSGTQITPAQQAPAGAKTLGDAFVKSEAYDAMRIGFKTGQMTGRWSSGPVEVSEAAWKAVVTTTASPIIQPQVEAGMAPTPAATTLRQLTVADLLAQGTTDSGTIRYLQEATITNAAAATAEGTAKPESTITFQAVDEPVRKVATFLPVTDEMLEDASQLRSYLDNRLRVFVLQAEENQLLNGSGTAPNIRGLLNRTGIQTATRAALGTSAGNGAGASVLGDAIYMAITNIRINALVEPDGIVMHPANWATVRLAKDTAGQYLGGGPMIGAYGNGLMASESLWGFPVVVTGAIAQNTALVGAFGTMAQVFYRNGLTVEASNSHADFFQLNQTAIRAEQRLALAVYRPQAFHAITALQTA